MDEASEAFIGELLQREFNRTIAAILGEIEQITGKKDPQTSRAVKDIVNAAKRILFTKLTKVEVEPKSY
jgi:NCAIR mutase (PurE)-related protein